MAPRPALAREAGRRLVKLAGQTRVYRVRQTGPDERGHRVGLVVLRDAEVNDAVPGAVGQRPSLAVLLHRVATEPVEAVLVEGKQRGEG